jgi:hypothetical protein
MEDKELVRRIRNSFKAKKSRAEIIENMTKRGYKIKYAEALIKKARGPKKFFIISAVVLIVLISLAVAFFAVFDPSPTTIRESGIAINSPLDGFKVMFGEKPKEVQASNGTEEEIYVEDITITPEFIAYLLQEIGALEALHKNPVTREIPIINFKIEETEYNAAFEEILEVSTGLNTKADIQFNSDKEAIVRATLDDNPATIFKDSIASKTTTIETIAGETELFAKGYLSLYDSLK